MNDQEMIYWALSMWANYIETGDGAMSKLDAVNMGKPVKQLEPEQLMTVAKIRDLRDRVMAGKVVLNAMPSE